MGVSYSTYVGVYIDIKPNKTINVENTVYGCEKCKTESISNFCPKCGSPHAKWDRSQKIKMKYGYEYLNFVLKQLDAQNSEKDFYYDDEFHTAEYMSVIMSNKNYYSNHLYNNDGETMVIDFKVAQTKVKEFEAKYAEFLAVMKKSGIEFDVVYGVIAYAS